MLEKSFSKFIINFFFLLIFFRATTYTPRIEENCRVSDTWRMKNSQRAVSIDNISFISCSTPSIMNNNDNNKENNKNGNDSLIKNNEQPIMNGITNHNNDNGNTNGNGNHTTGSSSKINNSNNNEDEHENIIPWRAQLRKTNSRLSLIG